MRTNRKRLTALVRKHVRFVERVLRNLGVPESEIDDAMQRTFIVVANRLHDIEEGAEKSFLFTSAKHMASHVRRNRARFKSHDPLEEDLPSPKEDPEQLVAEKKSRELLDSVLEALPEDLRVVFVLYELEELRVPEIAKMLDIPIGTVASRLRRAREQFQARVQRLEAVARHRVEWKVS